MNSSQQKRAKTKQGISFYRVEAKRKKEQGRERRGQEREEQKTDKAQMRVPLGFNSPGVFL